MKEAKIYAKAVKLIKRDKMYAQDNVFNKMTELMGAGRYEEARDMLLVMQAIEQLSGEEHIVLH